VSNIFDMRKRIAKPMPALLQPVFLRLRNVLDRLTGKELALAGGISTPGVVRVGDTVRRPVKENAAFVHDVLRYLELRGFDRVPRFLGIDAKGRAVLTYISGTVPRATRRNAIRTHRLR
jgi:hypothetical protein